jgi:protocatechuate 3,4-dioxygenase beta subunit
LVVAFGAVRAAVPGARVLAAWRCQLTQGTGIDPDYTPNPPLRSKVGTGFILTGLILSGIDCSPIAGARVEFWLRNPRGQYDDLHRGTAVTDGSGRYRIESNFPGGGGFGPHIHLRVAVGGYRPLVTIYFPRTGTTEGMYDIVLEPEI